MTKSSGASFAAEVPLRCSVQLPSVASRRVPLTSDGSRMSIVQGLREWVQLTFFVLGGIIALAPFLQSRRQRRVENDLKFVALFRDGLHEDDVEHWNELFRSPGELARAEPGHYLQEWETSRPIRDYFTEDAPDGYAIARVAATLDVVCPQIVTQPADAKTVYCELGQLLNGTHYWLRNTRRSVQGQSLLEASFPSIDAFLERFTPENAAANQLLGRTLTGQLHCPASAA